MHPVGFTIEIYYDARPYERQSCDVVWHPAHDRNPTKGWNTPHNMGRSTFGSENVYLSWFKV